VSVNPWEHAFQRGQALRREDEERVNLEKAEYFANERAFVIAPARAVLCIGGPEDGRVMFPHYCECTICERGGSHGDTLPVLWNPNWDYAGPEHGNYRLAYVWDPEGSVSTRLVEAENGSYHEREAEE
jgi:hypothetical protein